MLTLIHKIHQLAGIQPSGTSVLKGEAMKTLPSINNAYLIIENEKILRFGPMAELPELNFDHKINAEGRIVLPGFNDSHTHIVFAKSRENEFVDRINGLSYEQIAANGGGILNSAEKLANASEDELYASAAQRLNQMMAYGTTAIEIKSGYGLSTAAEIKMLRVIKRLKANFPLDIKANFLAAHAMPTAFKTNRQGYISLIINEMLPIIHAEGLADYIDVFCDRGFYTPEETEQILVAGAAYGLKPKIHANELDYSGGVQIGVKYGAISVDHLECVAEAEIACLKTSETIATVLPSTAFFLKLPHYPPARLIIDSGLPMAIATDYNPGSSPSGRMALALSIACTQMAVTPAEAINAATINGAAALEIGDVCGSITEGKLANLILTTPLDSYNAIPYFFGDNVVEKVWLKGQLTVNSGQ